MLQPPRLRDAGWPERLTEVGADVAVVVAFGQILQAASPRLVQLAIKLMF